MRGPGHQTNSDAKAIRPIFIVSRLPSLARGAALAVFISTLTALGTGQGLANQATQGDAVTLQRSADRIGPEEITPKREFTERAQVSEPVAPVGTGVGNLKDALGVFISSPVRRQFASELGGLLRQGNRQLAEQRLNTAIELGTLALLLMDRIGNPDLPSALQDLGFSSEAHPNMSLKAMDDVQPSPDRSGQAQVGSMVAQIAELEKARERERQRADTAEHERETVMAEMRRLQEQETRSAATAEAQLAEVQSALERERKRAEIATRELGTVTQERRALQARNEQAAATAANLNAELLLLKNGLAQSKHRDRAAETSSSNPDLTERLQGGNPVVATAGSDDSAAPPSSVPSSSAVQGTHAFQLNTGSLRGVPEILNASTLSLRGQVVRLFGVETGNDPKSTEEFANYLGGREVVCEPSPVTESYHCQVDGKDLSLVVLFNGGGRTTSEATADLKTAAARAQSAGVGVWGQ